MLFILVFQMLSHKIQTKKLLILLLVFGSHICAHQRDTNEVPDLHTKLYKFG